MGPLTIFALGCAGSLCFELLKAYEYYGKFDKAKWELLYKSKLFWLVFVGMIAASGFFSWAINSGFPNQEAWRVVLSGIAGRSIVRQGIATKIATKSLNLGSKKNITFEDLFL